MLPRWAEPLWANTLRENRDRGRKGGGRGREKTGGRRRRRREREKRKKGNGGDSDNIEEEIEESRLFRSQSTSTVEAEGIESDLESLGVRRTQLL